MPAHTRLLGSQGNLSKLAQPNKSRQSNKNLRELYDGDLDDYAKPLQPQPKQFPCKVEGEWTESTSGGNMSYATWRNNPQYNLDFPHNLTEATEVKITLSQSCMRNTERVLEEEPESDVNKVGFYVCRRDGIYAESELRDKRFVTFSQEHFVCVSQFSQDSVSCEVTLPASHLAFVLIPVTFVPGHLAKFTLTVDATHPVQLAPLDTQISSWYAASCTGEWSVSGGSDGKNLQENLSGFNTAGGCRHHITWRNNPQFALNVEEPAIVLISLSQEAKPDLCTMGIYVANKTTERHQRKMIMNSVDIMGKTLFCCVKEIQLELSLCPSTFGYRIVPSTYSPGECNRYEINVWSTQPLTLEPVAEHWSFVASDGEWKLPPRSLSARSLASPVQANPVHVSFTTDLAPRSLIEADHNPDATGIKQLQHDIVPHLQPLLVKAPPRLPSLLGPAPDVIPSPATSTPFGYYADSQGVFMLKFQASTTDLSVVIALLHISGPELKNQGFHVLRVDAEDDVKGERITASHVVTTEFAKKWEISRKIMGLSSDVTLLIIPAFLSDESADSGSGCKFRVGVFGTVAPGQMSLAPLSGSITIVPKKKVEEEELFLSSPSQSEDDTDEEDSAEGVVPPVSFSWARTALWAGVFSGVGFISYSLWRAWKLKQRRGR